MQLVENMRSQARPVLAQVTERISCQHELLGIDENFAPYGGGKLAGLLNPVKIVGQGQVKTSLVNEGLISHHFVSCVPSILIDLLNGYASLVHHDANQGYGCPTSEPQRAHFKTNHPEGIYSLVVIKHKVGIYREDEISSNFEALGVNLAFTETVNVDQLNLGLGYSVGYSPREQRIFVQGKQTNIYSLRLNKNREMVTRELQPFADLFRVPIHRTFLY